MILCNPHKTINKANVKLLFSVASYWNAQDQALSFNPDIAISILEPGARSPEFGIEQTRHLRIGFNDIEASEIGRIAPSLDHIKTIINFTKEQRATGARRLMVHCMAGVSRSPAAAYILAVVVRGDDPVRAARVLFQSAPFVSPNLLMVRHADTLGHFNGSMLRAVQKEAAISRTATHPQPFVI